MSRRQPDLPQGIVHISNPLAVVMAKALGYIATVRFAAEEAGLSTQRVEELIREGRLPSQQIHRKTYVVVSDLQALVEKGQGVLPVCQQIKEASPGGIGEASNERCMPFGEAMPHDQTEASIRSDRGYCT